jgi:hypothetical protein
MTTATRTRTALVYDPATRRSYTAQIPDAATQRGIDNAAARRKARNAAR